MCGIVGYVGKNNANDILINGLKALEYRGYDSSGIAYVFNNQVKIIKSEGKVSKLEEKMNANIKSNLGIGHTRWATHGIPNETNAHPHHIGKTTLVHNGIIENYVELKNILSQKYHFQSQTDTEVACALIDDCYNETKNKLEALKKASEILKGSYAFAIIFDDDLENIYAMRKDSPLIVAKADNEYFLASDIAAILKYTNEYYLLDQNDLAIIGKDGLRIFNHQLKEIQKDKNIYQGTSTDIMKDGYSHFMLKEIHEETKVYQNIIDRYFPNFDILELENNFGRLAKYEKITIIGCGSAYHAGLVAKTIFEEYANVPTNVELASEYRYKKCFHGSNDLVIVISQSGETADTLEALRKANQNNIDTLGIINVLSSSIARESKKVIYSLAGCEIAVATTKAYQSQVLILSLIAILLSYQKKIISREIANEYLLDIKDIIKETNAILKKKEDYNELAKDTYKENNMFFIGRGLDYSICMEASLKMKEISYIHSEAYAAGELKHGTISLIENNTIVFGIVTQENIASKTISNLKETKARGSKIILVTTDELFKNYKDDNFYDEAIIVKKTNPYLQALTITTPLQLLAFYTALRKGENIDKPRNLAKSVTVE